VFASQLANKMWDLINGEIEIEMAERRRVATASGRDIANAARGGTWATPLICRHSHGIGGIAAALAEARWQGSGVGSRDNDNKKTKATAAAAAV
jgi:hypothetical protein